MLRLFKLSELHFKNNDLGLAICNYFESEHLGLLIKSEDNPLAIYDFINHKSPLYKGDVGDYHLCKFSNFFDEDSIMTFNNTLSYVLDELCSCDIPFSIIFSEDIFDFDLSKLMESVGLGFTCTTIILGIFKHINLEIIDKSTWPIGLEEDKKIQQDIVNSLKFLYPEHAQKQQDYIGKVPRFSPIQVLIAFIIFMGKPISYGEIEPYIENIKNQLIQHDLLLEQLESIKG